MVVEIVDVIWLTEIFDVLQPFMILLVAVSFILYTVKPLLQVAPNPNTSRLVLQLSSPSPLKPGVNSRMKMQLEQHRQAMLQLHLSDQQVYCLQKYYLIY